MVIGQNNKPVGNNIEHDYTIDDQEEEGLYVFEFLLKIANGEVGFGRLVQRHQSGSLLHARVEDRVGLKRRTRSVGIFTSSTILP